MKYRKIILIILIFFSLLFISYLNAKSTADNFMKPFLKEGYFYGASFQPVVFYRADGKMEKWFGPSWWLSYEHNTEMMVAPLSLRVNLFGRIIDTSPPNLKTILQDRIEKKSL